MREILLLVTWLMMLVIVGSVVISWLRMLGVRVPYGNPFVRAIDEMADAMIRPIRNAFPTTGGGLDFSPMIAIIILYIIRAVIQRL